MGASAPNLNRRLLYGAAADEILAAESNGLNLWHLTDHLGTTRDLVDDVGDHVQHFEFDSYGRLLNSVTFSTLLLFNGREYDTDTKMYYVRARWYDPHVGRWLSEDPIGYAGQDTNLYRYVANSPVNYTDPSGLAQPVGGGGGGVSIKNVANPSGNKLWAFDKNSQLFGPLKGIGRAKIEPGRIPLQGSGVAAGRHSVTEKESLANGQFCGTGGAEPCIGLTIVEPGPRGSVYVFHFSALDDPVATILQYRDTIARGSEAVVFGGDNTDPSNATLFQVLSAILPLRGEILGLDMTVNYADTEGLWVDGRALGRRKWKVLFDGLDGTKAPNGYERGDTHHTTRHEVNIKYVGSCSFHNEGAGLDSNRSWLVVCVGHRRASIETRRGRERLYWSPIPIGGRAGNISLTIW